MSSEGKKLLLWINQSLLAWDRVNAHLYKNLTICNDVQKSLHTVQPIQTRCSHWRLWSVISVCLLGPSVEACLSSFVSSACLSVFGDGCHGEDTDYYSSPSTIIFLGISVSFSRFSAVLQSTEPFGHFLVISLSTMIWTNQIKLVCTCCGVFTLPGLNLWAYQLQVFYNWHHWWWLYEIWANVYHLCQTRNQSLLAGEAFVFLLLGQRVKQFS